MKLFLITRTDETDYDETNAILVRGENKTAAKALALGVHVWPNRPGQPPWFTPRHPGLREDNLIITEVTVKGEAQVIIHDFMRG